MNELFCKEFLDYFPTYTELKDLRLTFTTNCIFNNFITHTSIMLNIVTIYAIHKTSAMAKTLKTLLLSLAFSDLAVGLYSQPLYTFFLVKCLQLDNLNCDTYQVLIISGYLWCCGCKCRQVLSCSSSSQISRACDSQACCCCGDRQMVVQCICFFDNVVGVTWYSGSYRVSCCSFRFHCHFCGVHQDIFYCTTAQETDSLYASTRSSSLWWNKKLYCSYQIHS